VSLSSFLLIVVSLASARELMLREHDALLAKRRWLGVTTLVALAMIDDPQQQGGAEALSAS
jgi:hypothetical protein